MHEARKEGATIELPDINQSDYLTCIDGKIIYLGLIHLAHLEKKKNAEGLLEERARNIDYQGLDDITLRTRISLEQIIILIRIRGITLHREK